MQYPIIINPYQEIIIDYSIIENDAKEHYFQTFKSTYKGKNTDIPEIVNNPPKEPSIGFLFTEPIADKLLSGKFIDVLFTIFTGWITLPLVLIDIALSLILYPIRLIIYRYEFNNYTLQSDKFLAEYELEKEEEQKAFINYLQEHNSAFQHYQLQLITEAKNYQITNKITNVKQPIISMKETQKGISENFFYKHLKGYFDDINFEIICGQQVGEYIPDFIIKSKHGWLIDIEIDEPYIGYSKEVIHYYNTENNFYSDEARNTFFKDNGWIVIRFTEKQIIQNPLSCCFVISHVIEETFDFSIVNKMKVGQPQHEKLWSKKQADEMALFNYRNSYIPEELKKNFG